MRIALDATYSVGPNLSGVGVYSKQILAGLPAAHAEHCYLYGYRPHHLRLGLRAPHPDNVTQTLLWGNWPWRVDLFHGLNQRIDRHYKRTVSTFHDLFVMTAEYSTPEFRARFAQQARIAAERSDLIIAVSAFTATQVEDLLAIPRSRIRVVHHGVLPAAVKSPLSSAIVLFVGAIQKRKNILRLVQAFEQTLPGWKLVLAGSAGFGAEEILQAIARSPRKQDIEVTGYVAAEALEQLYRTASIFAFPSLDEGFGMPVLEAMAHGIPVLTSNISALAEIAGSAALLVNPQSTDEIAAGLTELMGRGSIRQDLAERGINHSAHFTWAATMDKTWDVYRELLD